MPLACLTAVAGGISSGPAVRVGFLVFTVNSGLGQRARRRAVRGSRSLAVAPANPADPPAGLLRLAARCRWLAAVESGQGWQPVQLRPDSLALPMVVVLRFRLRGERRVRAICVPGMRRRRMCTDACGSGSNSADVGGRHQNSVQCDRQHVRVVEGVMQATAFLALHG